MAASAGSGPARVARARVELGEHRLLVVGRCLVIGWLRRQRDAVVATGRPTACSRDRPRGSAGLLSRAACSQPALAGDRHRSTAPSLSTPGRPATDRRIPGRPRPRHSRRSRLAPGHRPPHRSRRWPRLPHPGARDCPAACHPRRWSPGTCRPAAPLPATMPSPTCPPASLRHRARIRPAPAATATRRMSARHLATGRAATRRVSARHLATGSPACRDLAARCPVVPAARRLRCARRPSASWTRGLPLLLSLRSRAVTVLASHPPPNAEHRVQGLGDDVGVALLRQQPGERGGADGQDEGVVLDRSHGGADQQRSRALLALLDRLLDLLPDAADVGGADRCGLRPIDGLRSALLPR